ncbi:MAG: pyridoxamine 5'-phosphate oxidase [Deltaproteobacteria bacterium RBG_19FT_COMBO_43_11]|nr:MAG: pyridoxamine 5'-phosphate oxidase [Deltaproteobacteria bacterium RBG_19FT_COMBO_43_11]
MRRKDKEIVNYREIEEIMRQAMICRISLVDGEYPYIVPVNFVVNDKNLYFHSSAEGKKIEILRKNKNVCFEMDIQSEIVKGKSPCAWGMKYLSVVGFGRAFFIDNSDEKKRVLNMLVEKYAGEGDYIYQEEILQKVIVIGVIMEKITGKKSRIP